jgi:DNA-binding CsgD family transcriptional regulator
MLSDTPVTGTVKHFNNSVSVTYSSTFYQGLDDIQYQVKLSGRNGQWSDWERSGRKTFSNLKEGDYTFFVRGKNSYGKVSEVAAISFKILPPWYRTWYAYLSYGMVLIILVLVVNLYYRRMVRIEKRKAILDKQRELIHKDQQMAREAEIADQEIMKLRNEKLRSDIRHKSIELANSAMNIIQKNKILTELKTELRRIIGSDQDHLSSHQLNRLIKKIDRNIEDKKDWKVFESNFDKVHENFLQSLSKRYPDLTPKDLRLSAYLRMNLQTKEIAPLMNISVRGVEISRYRLRKKLDLPHDSNLTEFMMGFDVTES